MAGTQSIADLTTKIQETDGDIPPSLMGATSTIVGDQLYLFGGRLQASAQVYNRLYVLNLTTRIWTRLITKNDAPTPRYFHSANVCRSRVGDKNTTCIIFYGGLTVSTTESNGLCSLGDLSLLILDDENEPYWEYPSLTHQENIPHERYSHLTTMTHNDRYFVVLGGQDVNAGYIDEINVYDCRYKRWHKPYPINSHYCTYRTAAATVTPISPSISIPSSSNFPGVLGNPLFAAPVGGLGGAGYMNPNNPGGGGMIAGEEENRDLEEAVHHQKLHSTIFTYSNYNFYDLKRTLHQITISNKGHVVNVTDYTPSLIGSRQNTPPALRFPSGFACGHHLIVVGPCITPESQQLHVWALNVVSMTWSRIDAGPALSRGSWLRGLLHEDRNQFIVFGHPERSMQDDHTQRVVHFDYFASVDTEAFGVYRPPRLTFGPAAQEAGLALLSNPALSDITMVSTDGYRVRANSKILAQRWPSVHSRLTPLVSPTTKTGLSSTIPSSSLQYTLTFPDAYDILIAFLQFLYTDHLTTVEQNQPRILTRLLLLADLFSLDRLKALAVHSLHQMLQISTAPDIYQTAALADCASLQIRALRVMVNAKKMIQHQQNQQQQTYQLQHQQQLQQQQPQQTQSLVDRLASSSQQSSSTYQPLSKLLRHYDLNTPIPPNAVVPPSSIPGGNNITNNNNNNNNNNNATSLTADLATFPAPPSPPTRSPYQRSNTAPPVRAKNPSRKNSNSTATTSGSPTTPHSINTINTSTSTPKSRPSSPSTKPPRNVAGAVWLPMTF
ncbi:hypothetical protein BDA99DRAFT_503786 [Phascolomyces articulosus]|uniref:BTB domain-containing protein n=1 Tax=Phascolomyces articulosus TaxID=60185 RepID=A0AAD5PGH5_9FUNG|nr:hypothetical protein BDA99DRAFT_503786 [Phascolomyces articulosus]